jgi:hypothetical protein
VRSILFSGSAGGARCPGRMRWLVGAATHPPGEIAPLEYHTLIPAQRPVLPGHSGQGWTWRAASAQESDTIARGRGSKAPANRHVQLEHQSTGELSQG